MLKKDIAKQYFNNARLIVPDNASLVVYQVALAKHWLMMGLKTKNSLVDVLLFKMEEAIENIASLAAVGNLAINYLMECEGTTTITTKATSTEEPKWTTVMVKNVCQVVNQVVETLADTPKQEDHKLNLCLMGFEAKDGETKKELVQRFNTKLL
jgi:hypothetical protein